jgi:hypothetical protein
MLSGKRAVLFTLATGTGADRWDKARIVVQSLASDERKTLVEGGSSARFVPSGHIVYAPSGAGPRRNRRWSNRESTIVRGQNGGAHALTVDHGVFAGVAVGGVRPE